MVMLGTSIEGKFLWMETYSHHKFSSGTTFFNAPGAFLNLVMAKS